MSSRHSNRSGKSAPSRSALRAGKAFGVVSPFSRSLAVPLVYPTQPAGDGAMKRFIDHWIGPKQRQGVFDAAYE